MNEIMSTNVFKGGGLNVTGLSLIEFNSKVLNRQLRNKLKTSNNLFKIFGFIFLFIIKNKNSFFFFFFNFFANFFVPGKDPSNSPYTPSANNILLNRIF